jgi:hypothetical protein
LLEKQKLQQADKPAPDFRITNVKSDIT